MLQNEGAASVMAPGDNVRLPVRLTFPANRTRTRALNAVTNPIIAPRHEAPAIR